MSDAIHDHIKTTIDSKDVVLFMKGTPVFPQCGFSSVVARVLDHLQVDFASVNVLEDQGIREGIKTFSNWPTIPQLYMKGEFLGGSDIMMEMWEQGELESMVAELPKKG